MPANFVWSRSWPEGSRHIRDGHLDDRPRRGLSTAWRPRGHRADDGKPYRGTGFVRGRERTAVGERLRHEGRLQEACARVGAALASFEALGARPWAKRAQRLIAAWGRARSMGSSSYPRAIRPSTTGATGEFAVMYSIVTSSRPSPGCSTSVPPASAL
jgi:hypothetical protein